MIYFIQQGTDGPIKIGFAADCERRLDALQTGNPHDLHLLAVMGGDINREKELHQRFAEGNLRGEWFQPDTPGLHELVFQAIQEEALIEAGARYCDQCGIRVVQPPRRKLCSAECERLKKMATARAWKKRRVDIPVVEDLDARLESVLLQVIPHV